MWFVNDCRGALGKKNCNPVCSPVASLSCLSEGNASAEAEMPELAFPKIPVGMLPGTFQGAPREEESSLLQQGGSGRWGMMAQPCFDARLRIPRLKAHPGNGPGILPKAILIQPAVVWK